MFGALDLSSRRCGQARAGRPSSCHPGLQAGGRRGRADQILVRRSTNLQVGHIGTNIQPVGRLNAHRADASRCHSEHSSVGPGPGPARAQSACRRIPRLRLASSLYH